MEKLNFEKILTLALTMTLASIQFQKVETMQGRIGVTAQVDQKLNIGSVKAWHQKVTG